MFSMTGTKFLNWLAIFSLLGVSLLLPVRALADGARVQERTIFNNTHPLSSLHLTWQPLTNDAKEPGDVRVRASLEWSSTAVVEQSHVVDAESRFVFSEFSVDLSEADTVSLLVPVVWRGSGFMDEVINWWHDAFGLPEGDRNQTADNKYLIAGVREDGEAFELDEDGTGLGNFRLRWTSSLGEVGGIDDVAFGLDLSLPTASEEFGHNGVDLGAGLRLLERLDRWTIFLDAAYLYYSDPDLSGLRFRENHLEGGIGVDRQLGDSFFLGLAFNGSSETVTSIADYPDWWLYFDVYGGYEFSGGSVFTFGVRENPGNSGGTVDVQFHLGLITRIN